MKMVFVLLFLVMSVSALAQPLEPEPGLGPLGDAPIGGLMGPSIDLGLTSGLDSDVLSTGASIFEVDKSLQFAHNHSDLEATGYTYSLMEIDLNSDPDSSVGEEHEEAPRTET